MATVCWIGSEKCSPISYISAAVKGKVFKQLSMG